MFQPFERISGILPRRDAPTTCQGISETIPNRPGTIRQRKHRLECDVNKVRWIKRLSHERHHRPVNSLGKPLNLVGFEMASRVTSRKFCDVLRCLQGNWTMTSESRIRLQIKFMKNYLGWECLPKNQKIAINSGHRWDLNQCLIQVPGYKEEWEKINWMLEIQACLKCSRKHRKLSWKLRHSSR